MLVIPSAYDRRYRGTWWSHRRGRCWRRGVGFVDCYDYSKAQVAMAAMSGVTLPDGKVLRV